MFKETGFNPLSPKAIKEGEKRRNEKEANYYRLMDSLTDEQLADIRIGKLKVVVQDTVRALVKKQ